MKNASLGQLTTASDSLWWMAICNILDSGVTMQLKLVKTRIRPIATQKFLIDGHRIAYMGSLVYVWEPVVPIHGTPSSSLIWCNVAPQTTEAGSEVHVFLISSSTMDFPRGPGVQKLTNQCPAKFKPWKDCFGIKTSSTSWLMISAAEIGQRFGIFYPDRLRHVPLIDAVSFDNYPSHGKLRSD